MSIGGPHEVLPSHEMLYLWLAPPSARPRRAER